MSDHEHNGHSDGHNSHRHAQDAHGHHAHQHDAHGHNTHGHNTHGHNHGHNTHGHNHGHGHGHGHNHGHELDQGIRGLARYLLLLPRMWRAVVSDEVVRQVAPVAGERVVDLGAGMGAATVVAAKRGVEVLAVDPTPYMRRILELRRRWQPFRSGITVLDGAAESIPVKDRSIDALWTVNTIHHWTQRTAAARELARVMRPGGRVMLVDEDFEDPAHPSFVEMKSRRAKHGHHFDEVDPAAVAAELLEAGFASAEGSRAMLAGRPVKLIRATR